MKIRPRSITLFLCLTLACAAARAAADLITEVIPLGYRSAREIIPVLKPLLPAPGSVSGLQSQIVVRTTPRNMAELKDIIARLDRAPENLLVSVRHTATDAVRRDLAAAGLAVRAGRLRLASGAGRRAASGPALQARVRILSTRRRGEDRDLQTLRVLEGREAFIRTGQAVPIADRRLIVTGTGTSVEEGVRYLDVSRGFRVRVRLDADRVTVEIAPRRDSLATTGGGVIDRRRTATVVSGQLGRWMRIGGIEQRAVHAKRTLSGSTRAHLNSDYGL